MNTVADLQHPAASLDCAALTIAGSDACGGAGIQADLKTFAAFGVHGASALTAVTAQNTLGVTAIESLPARFVAAQIRACLDDLPLTAIKTGMLASSPLIEAIVAALPRDGAPLLVIDPVMVATSGDRLLDESATRTLVDRLLPRAALVTPNRPEAAILTGADADAPVDELADRMLELGLRAVLIKDGHGSDATCRDLLATSDGRRRTFDRARRPGRYHGTGCALSAAICALLARGETLEVSVARAGDWLAEQIAQARMPTTGDLALLPFSRG
ncbi:bifunctional hydroxymethylpyrimidine kinase/phosphomethylpyrimidine kinase [Halomonas denitrificans]|nr:bifunctional hydroxymethylpyrimidine kinase/phosphomethylpyrimidine kinase [Halomonas denitrificans]